EEEIVREMRQRKTIVREKRSKEERRRESITIKTKNKQENGEGKRGREGVSDRERRESKI
ncbi:uncharacterized protein LOC110036121, partial [Phalaenopsis equestris]|uniref:uncharacterized protein LOC110036121 n=1 Tax=Phalaenopsis equestris TaxID=78828 RepID=UPI0009E62178